MKNKERETEKKNSLISTCAQSKISSNLGQKLSTPFVTHEKLPRETQKTRKVENSRKKCLNRLAMSILGLLPLLLLSVSLPAPALYHCSCRVIPCEHPESWADCGAGQPTLCDHVVRIGQ